MLADCPASKPVHPIINTCGTDAAMLPEQPPSYDTDDVPVERRLNSIRLFVIREGRLIELERRERDGVTKEPDAAYSPQDGAKPK
jgi:hypothetical protein